MSTNLNLNLNLTIDAWAEIVIKIWRNKITELDIGHSGQLFDSFTNDILSNSGGSAERVDFAFSFYGKFVDMGVGKGVPLELVGDSSHRRRPRRWYSSTFISQTFRLREILADKYGIIGATVITENLRKGEKLSPSHANSPGKALPSFPSSKTTELDKIWMERNGLL